MRVLIFTAAVVSLFTTSFRFSSSVDSATPDTSPKPAATAAKPVFRPVYAILTAYVPDPGSLTSTGKDANAGPGLAADPGMFPPGTKILIPGKGTFAVDDTGGHMIADAKRGIRHIDLRIVPRYRRGIDPDVAYRHAVDHANEIGIHWVNVYIVSPPPTSSRNG